MRNSRRKFIAVGPQAARTSPREAIEDVIDSAHSAVAADLLTQVKRRAESA